MSEIKPPLGLKPKMHHDMSRIVDILEAMSRCMEAEVLPDTAWGEELLQLLETYEKPKPKEDIDYSLLKTNKEFTGL